ncbi:sigma-70 family RNA polymerase sigma factor [Pseudobacillus badius]|uniref:sigma-70 family RNA polymerase sigma factor n=1 Tax=Bacillus badius TaxID=1455 RepID=UPI0007B3E334|nr:sigma-70 family RNA polymerase sigma factor [Bacillus badius]KZR57920.1 hypothetical protein A3781_19275 [Bacillus badius]
MEVRLDVPIHELTDEEFVHTYGRLVPYAIHSRFGAALEAINFNTGLEFDDLNQIGTIGLLKARKRFEPDRGLKFSTYAIPLILGEISIALRDTNKIKVPRLVHEIRNKVVKHNLENKSAAEVAEVLGIEEHLADKALQLRKGVDSLNKPIPGAEYLEFGHTIPDDSNFEGDLLNAEILREFFATLTDRERQIWYLYNKEELGQTEIAELVGVSQVTVSRTLRAIECKADMFGKHYRLQT